MKQLRPELQLSNYTAVSNLMLEDPNYAHLDYRALGAWSLIFSRYQSSFGKSNFYDKKQHDWYSVFTNSQLAKSLHVSDRTITKLIKSLVDAGLLFKKKAFNGVNKYFPLVPKKYTKAKDDESASNHLPQDNDVTKPQRFQFNYFISTLLSFPVNSVNAVNTQQQENTTESVITPKEQVQQNKNIPDLMAERREMITNQRYDNKINSLQTRLGMSKEMVAAMDQYAFHSLDSLNMYAKAITSGKKTAKRQFSKNPSLVDTDVYKWAFMFEENTYVLDGLPKKIKQVIVDARTKAHERPAKSQAEFNEHMFSYMVVCFTKYFVETGSKFIEDFRFLRDKSVNIPDFKLG